MTMKINFITTVFLFTFLSLTFKQSSVAGGCDPQQRTIKGDLARAFITSIKTAGFKSEKMGHSKSVIHYNIDALQCSYVNGEVYDDGINTYNCNVLPVDVVDNAVTSKLLTDSLSNMGVHGDSATNHVFYKVDKVACVINLSNGSGFLYSCKMTAIWADTCQP